MVSERPLMNDEAWEVWDLGNKWVVFSSFPVVFLFVSPTCLSFWSFLIFWWVFFFFFFGWSLLGFKRGQVQGIFGHLQYYLAARNHIS